MGNSLNARTAREALIVEALHGVDTMLAAADAVGERLSASSQRLESAAAGLTAAGTVYSAEVAQLTEATKRALADYIERRASAATNLALAEHRKAMQDAATLAFAEQLEPAVRDIARQVELHGSLIRNRIAPLVATFVLGAGLGVFVGIGGALLWMR
jgi:hypothetical protein